MFTVLMTGAHIKVAVKCIFWWKPCLFKFLLAIYTLVWVYAFAPHKPKNFLFIIQIVWQFIQTLCHKSAIVYKPKLNIFRYFVSVLIAHPCQLDVKLNITANILLFVFCYDSNIIPDKLRF